MPWHYFNENREKIGPFTSRELKQLVQEGTIAQETFIEDPSGRTGLAKDVKGLPFPEPEEPFIATPPPIQTAQAVPVSPFSVQNESAPSPAAAFAAQAAQTVRTHGQQTAKSAMSWLLDFAFRDIRIHVVNLWVCRIIYVLCWIATIIYGLVGTFGLIVLSYEEGPFFLLIPLLWLALPISMFFTRLLLEFYIVLMDWMVYTTRAARLYIEEKSDES